MHNIKGDITIKMFEKKEEEEAHLSRNCTKTGNLVMEGGSGGLRFGHPSEGALAESKRVSGEVRLAILCISLSRTYIYII